MIAVFGPVETKGVRERVALDLVPGAEGIPGPLDDQARSLDRLEVLRPQAFGLARRMEGVPEADQPGRLDLIGDQARHASAHRFAADGKAGGRQRGDNLAPSLQQFRLPVRGPLPAVGAPRRHIGELKASDPQAAVGQAFGKGSHEGAVHRRAGAMGQDQGLGCLSWPVEE